MKKIFKQGEIINIKLTNQSATILDIIPIGTLGYSYKHVVYIIRTQDYRELIFRDYELEEIPKPITPEDCKEKDWEQTQLEKGDTVNE